MQHIGLALEELTEDHIDTVFGIYRNLGLPILQGAKVTPASIRANIDPMMLADGVFCKELTPEPYEAPHRKVYFQSGDVPGLVYVGIKVDGSLEAHLAHRFVSEIKRNFL
ncbi:hypothetical protein HOF54_02935 [Candidatus Woesearchaeota archaeon]|jgi:hypothetical protein|nr:hypothetical protein [Candidatus Woesearchaeota archaeon]